MTPKHVPELVKKENIEYVGCQFMDFPGLWQHCIYAADELTEDSFETGFGFDGSSIRGWQEINESDMLLAPGFEAPVNVVYSSRNRSAAIRIPVYQDNPRTKRLEFRCLDTACNPYLAFAAMTMAAIDGIKNRIDPGDPRDLDALAADHRFLLEGGCSPRTWRGTISSTSGRRGSTRCGLGPISMNCACISICDDGHGV